MNNAERGINHQRHPFAAHSPRRKQALSSPTSAWASFSHSSTRCKAAKDIAERPSHARHRGYSTNLESLGLPSADDLLFLGKNLDAMRRANSSNNLHLRAPSTRPSEHLLLARHFLIDPSPPPPTKLSPRPHSSNTPAFPYRPVSFTPFETSP